MNQDRTPIIDAIAAFQNQKPAFFRIPAHRFDRGVDRKALNLLGEKCYRSDLTEAEGLDDLHHPEGVIKEAEALAAELYGSDRCWFLVNGTTSGNEAMILACTKPGDKILVPRNAHKSVLMGLELAGAIPVWIMPEYIEGWDIYGEVDPEKIRTALDLDPEIKAVFLVSPTYYGTCSDLRKISEICHEHKVPLLVDEAHGSHLYFDEEFPFGAIEAGADAAAQSIHKTAGSMTQSSMLQLKSSLIDPDRLDASIKLVTSTSPNYVLMASLDGARHMMACHGKEMMESAFLMTELAKEELSAIPGVDVHEDPKGDPLRLVFSMKRAGLTGFTLQEQLYEVGRVSTELADFANVVLVISWGNTPDDIRRLVETVRTIARDPEIYAREQSQEMTAELLISHEIKLIPPSQVDPRQAFFGKTIRIPWSEAIGRLAGEAVIPYPPGIPLICPGEVITGEIHAHIEEYAKNGLPMHGPADPKLETIHVLDQSNE